MNKDLVYLGIIIPTTLTFGFQWGRYDGYGTIFGYKTQKYYEIEENKKKYQELMKKHEMKLNEIK